MRGRTAPPGWQLLFATLLLNVPFGLAQEEEEGLDALSLEEFLRVRITVTVGG